MKLNFGKIKNFNPTSIQLLSIIVLIFFLIIFFVFIFDYQKDWSYYQRQYLKITLQLAETEEEKRVVEEFEIGIKQVVVEPLNRIDRCISCHVAIDQKGFEEGLQPLRSHPGAYLEDHPVDKFGCTVCHGGLGMATTARSAHGEPHGEGSINPMYRGVFVQSSCGKCHDSYAYSESSVLGKGKRLYELYGCNVCHQIYKSGGTAGPDLTTIGAKKYYDVDWGKDHKGEKDLNEWLINHFVDPSFYYESDMMEYEMNKENAIALTVYMLSLVPEEIPQEYICCKEN